MNQGKYREFHSTKSVATLEKQSETQLTHCGKGDSQIVEPHLPEMRYYIYKYSSCHKILIDNRISIRTHNKTFGYQICYLKFGMYEK